MTFMVLHQVYAPNGRNKILVPFKSLTHVLENGDNSKIFLEVGKEIVAIDVIESIRKISDYMYSAERDAASTMML